MKVYLVSHKGNPAWHKLMSWVDYQTVEPNGVCVNSVRAFIRKKDAKAWIKEKGWDHLEIKTAKVL